MPIVTFAPAVRTGAHVIVTAYGESGCGKTYSLIKLGRGLVGPKGKLALLDTETGRGMIYAKLGYDYAELTPPYTPERYIEAIAAAEEAGIEALIIDSGSHEWEGMGGVLEIADSGRSQSDRPLEGLIKWAKPKARHKRYVQRLLQSRMHLLISLRAKERMVQLTAKDILPRGARIGDIVSAGFVPIQDKRFIFETTVQLFLPVAGEHGVPVVEKCPEDLLGAFPDGARISEDTGRHIAEWVAGGVPVDRATDDLRRDAEEAAGQGTAALRAHWRGLGKSHRDMLADQVENLGSIAQTADDEAEERQREQADAHRNFRPADATEDPVGQPPIAQPDPPATADAAGGDRLAASSPPAARPRPTAHPRACEPHGRIDCHEPECESPGLDLPPAAAKTDWELVSANLAAEAAKLQDQAAIGAFSDAHRDTLVAMRMVNRAAAQRVANELAGAEGRVFAKGRRA